MRHRDVPPLARGRREPLNYKQFRAIAKPIHGLRPAGQLKLTKTAPGDFVRP